VPFQERQDGSGIYKLGSVVPVRFQLTDVNGSLISAAVANLKVQQYSGGTPAGQAVDATPPGAADAGGLFRYDGTQYVYNLSTKSLSVGIWQLQVQLNDGTVHTVSIGLK
jgi:hypothetical protein